MATSEGPDVDCVKCTACNGSGWQDFNMCSCCKGFGLVYREFHGIKTAHHCG